MKKTVDVDQAAVTREKQRREWLQVYLPMAKNFTQAYKDHLDDHVAVREGYCLQQQYPALCLPITDKDIFAGRRYYKPLVGFSAELNVNQRYPILSDPVGYGKQEGDDWIRENLGISNSGFCHDHWSLISLAEEYPEGSPEGAAIRDMVGFWDKHAMRTRYNQLLTDEIKQGMSRSTGFDTCHISGFIRQDCYSLDYDKLLRLGIPGLRGLICTKREESYLNGGDPELYTGMLLALDCLVNVITHYRDQALDMQEDAPTFEDKRRLRAMAETLDHIAAKKPENLRQAIQLFWLWNMVADSPNYGRMDQYLGDFYCNDIDGGRLTEEEAMELICGIWYRISAVQDEGGPTRPNARLVVGGKGRRNEGNADRFALAAMEASRRMRVNEPNVTLRFYDGQDPALMRKAVDVLAEGCIHPGLYNDDVHVPMVRDSFSVPEADAEQYLPEGCGELLIDHMGFGSPNNIHIFPAVLDLVLHNGYDRIHKEQRGLKLGELSALNTFDKLMDAVKKQVDYNNMILAKRHAIEHRAEAEKGAFLFMSILSDDCIERGKSLFDGGVRYLGGIIETFGLTSLADSMASIKKLVYDEKKMALEHMVMVLDADYEGFDKEYKLMVDAPKYGNDDSYVDGIHTELSGYACESANAAGKAEGLHFFLNCNLNPGGIYYAAFTPASPDGRRYGDTMALGNAPTPGRDAAGITSLLNSMAKHPKCHAGYVQNLKVGKNMFKGENRARFEALIDTYFKNGGIQLMVTALNPDDLRNALKEPEKWRHLQVRVAGWTGTYVDLEPRYQQQILKRTMYESY